MLRFFITVMLLFSVPLEAERLRHSVLETDTAVSQLSQRGCYGFYDQTDYVFCLPYNNLLKDDGEIRLDIFLKVNEEATDTLFKLSDKEIDQETLDKLFTQQNFQTVSGLARVSATYFNSILSYTPLHFVGAFRISNPSLPDFKLHGYQQNVLRFTQNFHLRDKSRIWDYLLAPSVFLYKRKFFKGDFDVLSASSVDTKKLVEKSEDSSADMDISLSALSKRDFVPSLTVQFFNTFNRYVCEECSERLIDTEYTIQTQFRVVASSFTKHKYGKSIVSAQIPYEGYDFKTNTELMSFSYIYKLSKLSSFLSFSSLKSSFGFLFDGKLYRVGIKYTDEKQENAISIERSRQTYVFFSLVL